MAIFSKLGAVMEEKGLTLEGVAAKAGISTRTVWTASKGKSISALSSRAIAKAVGVKPEDLR